MFAKLKTLLAGLSAVSILIAVAVSIFAAGELRNGFREKCGDREAGWFMRRACDWLDVVPPAPSVATSLKDTDAAEDADRHLAPACTTAQALEILDFKSKDGAALERSLDRDLDGDGKIGRYAPQRKGAPPRGELVLADKEAMDLPRGARLVVTVDAEGGELEDVPADETTAAPGDDAPAPAPARSGAVRVDVIPNEVPDYEWLHELEYQIGAELPVNGRTFGEEFDLSARWTFARVGPFRSSVSLWGARPSEDERTLLGKDYDWGARALLTIRCRGLLDCAAE